MENERKEIISAINKTDTGKTTEINTLLPHVEMSQRKTNILKRCLHDPVHKRKVLHSVWIGWVFISLGMAFGLSGPTLLDLQIVTNTDLETASFFLTAFSVGCLSGSALCGLIYDRVNKYLFMLSGVLGLGVFTIVTPYCFHYVAMIVIRAVAGVFIGVIDAVGNAEQMRVWGNEGSELMQMLHFCFALGGVLSPLYAEPFLAEKSADNSTPGSLTNYTDLSTVIPETQPTTTEVRYAFIIAGILCIISGIPWFIIYVQDKFGSTRDVIRPDGVVIQRKLPLPILLYMIFMISLMYLVYVCAEVGFTSFLMTFLVNEYDESKSKGAQFTSVFWAMFAASRFAMIFISQFLSAIQLLYISCFLTIVASICFTVSAMFSAIDAIAVFTALIGLSVSPVFPAGFSWAESHLVKVTSRVSASIMVSSSLGGMINPILMGYMMENVSEMWYCYLLVIEVIFLSFIFLTLYVTSKYFINKHYSFEHEASVSEGNQMSVANGTA